MVFMFLCLQVMIYRFVTRGTIEEKMMQMTKKKMVLEHLVVGKLKTQNINQVKSVDVMIIYVYSSCNIRHLDQI